MQLDMVKLVSLIYDCKSMQNCGKYNPSTPIAPLVISSQITINHATNCYYNLCATDSAESSYTRMALLA